MKFVEKVVLRMRGVGDFREFAPKVLDLRIIEHAHSRQIAIFVKESDLLGAQTKARRIVRRWHAREKRGDWGVHAGEVLRHAAYSTPPVPW